MSVQIKKDILVMPAVKDIVRGEWRTDVHMEQFDHLLRKCSDYRPLETWRLQCLETIQAVPINIKHIQILHSSSSSSDGHWVCSFYDTKNIFIYDSMNQKRLHEHHKMFLESLFPTYSFDERPVKFPIVQYQPNGNDSGVFVIAFTISLLFRIEPEKVKYNHNLMRSHLVKMFELNIIEHFPQDPQYGIFQKVLPLAVIRAREIEAVRIRTLYQNKKQKKSEKISVLSVISEKEYQNYSENYNSKQREYYAKNLENYRANKLKRYEKDLENNQHKKRKQYKQKLEENRLKQRRRYKQNLQYNRSKKQERYRKLVMSKCVSHSLIL